MPGTASNALAMSESVIPRMLYLPIQIPPIPVLWYVCYNHPGQFISSATESGSHPVGAK